MNPPYNITNTILQLISSISEKIGEINTTYIHRQAPSLRKQNRIRTIQASLAIEGNTLSEEQVTALIENTQATASRDLKNGTDSELLERTGEKIKRVTELPASHKNLSFEAIRLIRSCFSSVSPGDNDRDS